MNQGMKFSAFPEIRDSYIQNGYIAVQNFIPTHLITQVEKFVTTLFAAHGLPGENTSQTCIRLNKEDQGLLYMIYQTCSRSIEIDQIRIELKKVMNELFPGKLHIELGAGLLMGIPGDERISYDWHQEIHYHSELEDVIHFWLPVINEATTANGTMSILQGSNRLGKLPYKLKPKIVPNSVTNLVIEKTDELKKTNPEQFAYAKPGDMIGLHSYIVHRSNKNSSDDQVRFIISCRLAAIDKAPASFNFKVKEESL
jgi:hypothetical protein